MLPEAAAEEAVVTGGEHDGVVFGKERDGEREI
jgi:hypothetical protein